MKLIKLSELKSEATSHGGIEKLRKKVFIRKGEIPHLNQFAQAYFEPGAEAPKHKHDDMYETFLVETGEIEFTVNSKQILLKVGGTITLEPGEFHEVRNKSKEIAIMTYFQISK